MDQNWTRNGPKVDHKEGTRCESGPEVTGSGPEVTGSGPEGTGI